MVCELCIRREYCNIYHNLTSCLGIEDAVSEIRFAAKILSPSASSHLAIPNSALPPSSSSIARSLTSQVPFKLQRDYAQSYSELHRDAHSRGGEGSWWDHDVR